MQPPSSGVARWSRRPKPLTCSRRHAEYVRQEEPNALGMAFGATPGSYLPLLGLGVVSAGIGAAVALAASAVAKRGSLAAEPDKPHLPAT